MSSENSKVNKNSDLPDAKVEITGGELDVKEESGFYTAYAGFANNLRIWFIAFGIGAPVVLLSNETAWSSIVTSGLGQQLAYLYFSGVVVQILAALMYKTVMWYLYIGELKKSFRSSKAYRIADFLSENYLIEVVLDLITIILFGMASSTTIRIITNAL